MKILAIRGKNLASLAGEIEVDFRREPLASAGLFAITGATGSGKSTLLDALCLALYNKTPRLDNAPAKGVALPDVRDQTLSAQDPRNLLRRGTAEGWAEVEFVGNDGLAHRARWSVRRARASATGTLQHPEMTLVELPGENPIGRGLKETLAAIELRLGLTFEQLTRSVLLAQNEFFTLLKTDDNERAELLETLTGTDVFSTISTRAFERAKSEQEALRRIEDQLAGEPPLDPEARARLETELAAARAEVIGCEQRKGELEAHRRWHEELAKTLAAEAAARGELEKKTAARQEAAPRRARSSRIETVQPARSRVEDVERTARSLASCQDTVRRAETALIDHAQTTVATMTALGEAREKTTAAEKVRNQAVPALERAQRLDTQLEELAPRLEGARQTLREAQIAERKARQGVAEADLGELAELEARLEAAICALEAFDPEALANIRADLETRRAALETARELWRKLEEGRSREGELRVRLGALEQSAAAAEKQLAEVEAQLPASIAARDQAEKSLETVKTACSDVAQGLRHTLVEAEPCPVCGATEHPYTERDPQLQAALDRLAQEIAERRSDLDALTAEQAGQRAAAKSHRDQIAQQKGELERLAQTLAAIGDDWASHALASELAGISTDVLDDRLAAELETTQEALAKNGEQDRAYRRALKARETARATRDAAAARDERARAETALAQVESRARLLQEERGSLFGGKPAQDVAAELGAAIERAKTQEADLAIRAQEAQTARARAEEALEQARATLRERDEQAREAETALAGWLTDFNTRQPEEPALDRDGLRALLEPTSEWIATERKQLEDLDAAVQTALAVVQEREQRRQMHEAARPTPATLDEVETALATAREDLERASTQRTSLEVALRHDDARRQRVEKLAEDLARQKQIADLWAKLGGLIGSADGKKFRNYAQQLTLDVLLGFANHHLADLSRRYRLERVQGTLALLVVDQDMGDERRSVHSLSGGETFLVSLALALGLASLSSNRVRVESLFIDEGFGSLDTDSLRIAMDALDRLHAMGRKVGVISHVQEMTERIPTRIEVRKLTGGRSEVVVTGWP